MAGLRGHGLAGATGGVSAPAMSDQATRCRPCHHTATITNHHDAWVVYVHMPSSGGRLPACSPVAATWKCAVRKSRCMGSFPANQLFYALGRSTAYYNVATTWRSVTSNGCGEQRVRPGGRAMICVQPVCRARAFRREGDDATVIPCSAVAHAYCAATMCLLILFPRARAHQR